MTPAQFKKIREYLGLTQNELAKALGYPGGGSVVSHIEIDMRGTGRANLGGSALMLLRALLADRQTTVVDDAHSTAAEIADMLAVLDAELEGRGPCGHVKTS
jgi:transcriptional regulator with XRE-family HTH domain